MVIFVYKFPKRFKVLIFGITELTYSTNVLSIILDTSIYECCIGKRVRVK